MVKGNAAIEVYMGDKFLFPYDYLDELKDELKSKNKYNIYYVLKGPRFRISSMKNIDRLNCIVEIENLVDGNRIGMTLNSYAFFQLPDLSYIDLKIENGGSVLQVDFNEKGMAYLREYETEYLERNKKIIEEHGHMRLQYHVMFFRELFFNNQEEEVVDEYEVLYIGQSQKESIYERLYIHNTIPEILRYFLKDNNRDKYDLYIMTTGVHVKYFEEYNIAKYLTNIITSNSLKEDFIINEGLITKEEVINIAEAILILFFKPEYNEKLKNTKKPEELARYRIFNECFINPITYSLDLYFEDKKMKMILKTNTVRTEYKQNVLKCEFDEEGKTKDIALEHFVEDVYL